MKVSVSLFAVIAVFGALSSVLDEAGGADRLVDAAITMGIFAVVVMTVVSIANRHDSGDHF